MRRETHNRFSRMIVGRNVKMKDIDMINQSIDNPTPYDKNMRNMLGIDEDYDFMGLQEGGAQHRKYNHDPYVGLAKAMSINPEHGFEIYMSHMMMDRLSNAIRDSLGTENRDMAEIILNRYLKSVNKNLPRSYPRARLFRSPIMTQKPNPLKNLRRRNKFYRMKMQQQNRRNNNSIW